MCSTTVNELPTVNVAASLLSDLHADNVADTRAEVSETTVILEVEMSKETVLGSISPYTSEDAASAATIENSLVLIQNTACKTQTIWWSI